jgi:hypothetical protein
MGGRVDGRGDFVPAFRLASCGRRSAGHADGTIGPDSALPLISRGDMTCEPPKSRLSWRPSQSRSSPSPMPNLSDPRFPLRQRNHKIKVVACRAAAVHHALAKRQGADR